MSVPDIAERAPAFTLKDAVSQADVTLASLLANGPAILEFIRGTW